MTSLLFGLKPPIANQNEDNEEDEEAEDGEEEEYSYEEEEEEEEEGEWEERVDKIERMEEKQTKEGDDEEERKAARKTCSELADDCRRLVEVPEEAFECEAKQLQLQNNERFWVPCSVEGFRCCEIEREKRGDDGDGDDGTEGRGEVNVVVAMGEDGGWTGRDGEEEVRAEAGNGQRGGNSSSRKRVSRECLQRMSVTHLCADMCQLSELNEPSVLACIRARYRHRLIHTYSGLFCVVVNPWRALPPLYSGAMRAHYARSAALHNADELSPHVFSIAQSAFDGIASATAGGSSQSILITGESGAGKTENTKRIIEYLIDVAGGRRSSGESVADTSSAARVDQMLISAGTALEAFANAQTVHNNNSSRLGKFTRINFDHRGRMQSARIDCYLLEKSRVVSQNPGDRNFHIFYRLLVDPHFMRSEKAARIVRHLWRHDASAPRADAFHFLNQGSGASAAMVENVHAKFVDDAEGARETELALDQLGFCHPEKGWLRELIIACALIGQIRFGERNGLDVSFVEQMAELEAVAELLGVRACALCDALTQPCIRVGEALIRRSQPLRKTRASAQALAKYVYERVFGWVVRKCNAAIAVDVSEQGQEQLQHSHFIGVLDMAGFEIMARNSFEQLCINYTNERLQQFFNEFMFVREQLEYRHEGISWTQQDYGHDLQPTIDLIEKPLGILSLLQEECIVPNGSDQSLLDKMVRRLGASAPAVFAKAKQSSRNPHHHHHFTIMHYAGSVAYTVEGWLEKNRDAMDAALLEVLSASEHPLLAQLFAARSTPSSAARGKTPSPRAQRGSAMTHATISHVYREQLAALLGTLGATRAHFIRCIVPNHQRRPFELDGTLVMQQLRCNGVLEGIRICRQGYPNRIPFADFLARFRVLIPRSSSAHSRDDLHEAVHAIGAAVGVAQSRYQIGRTKVFCRVGLISELELARKDRLSAYLCGLQAWIRWWRVQRDFCDRRAKFESLCVVQNAVRNHVSLHRWPWYRVLQRVRQLIPLAHQRRRLAELEAEHAELRAKHTHVQRELEHARTEACEREDRAEKAEERGAQSRAKADELCAELKRNEELLERMERKFDEQHAKIVRLNGTLGEHVRAMERMEEERNALQVQLETVRHQHHELRIERESAEESLRAMQEECVRARADADELAEAMHRVRVEASRRAEELDECRERAREQDGELTELNHALAEANGRLVEMQPQLHVEKSARRKAEGIAQELEVELGRTTEELDRANAKREAQKEQLRAKDAQMRRLERKLEDKCTEMEDCVTELKRAHRRAHTEAQEQLEELRRKCLRLETENAQQRCKLESQAQDTAATQLQQKSRSRHRLDRLGSGTGLDNIRGGGAADHCRESSVDSDCGGVLLRSLTARHSLHSAAAATAASSSLHRARHRGGAAGYSSAMAADSSAPPMFGLRRSASGVSSVGTASSACGGAFQRNDDVCTNAMITSLTATVDSGLLTRSPSSASTMSGSVLTTLNQRLDGAERRAREMERELQQQRQDAQISKRELDVYKQQLQEAERARDTLCKQMRALNGELEAGGRALKAQEERAQTMEFEARKAQAECAAAKQRMEEECEEARAEATAERKKHAEKLEEMAHEYDSRLRQLTNSQRSTEQLQIKLAEAESKLDKAVSQLAHAERLHKSQSAIGDTWEAQYRTVQAELEGARDENAALKSRLRRQQRQIELLTQQTELDTQMDELEARMDRLGTTAGGGSATAAAKMEEEEEEAEREAVEVMGQSMEMEVTLFPMMFNNNNC